MPSAVSTPDLDVQNSGKKIKSKRFSPSMKLRNLKGRSTPDIKIDENKLDDAAAATVNSLDVSTAIDAAAEISITRAPSLPDTTSQEYSILEKCIQQYEAFFQVYLSQNILNIDAVATATTSKLKQNRIHPVLVNLIHEQSSVDSSNSCTSSTSATTATTTADDIIEDYCPERIDQINLMFETLKIKEVCRTTKLHSLLHETIATKSETHSLAAGMDVRFAANGDRTEQLIGRLMNLKLSDSLLASIRLASSLLVEMSTFPNYNQTMLIDNLSDIPCWLKVLVLIACYSKMDRDLQLASIATLFDLVSLIKSQLEHSTNPGVTYVVMLPLLKYGHVNYMEHKTRCIQVITSTLWDYLGDYSVDPNQISSLLYQLHNCLGSGIVETVIGHRIANTHIEWSSASDVIEFESPTKTIVNLTGSVTSPSPPPAMDRLIDYRTERLSDMQIVCPPPSQSIFDCTDLLTESESMRFKKFELLWEHGRGDGGSAGGRQCSRGFEKTLLKVYDHLAQPHHVAIRTFVTKWLQESMLRNDLNRLISPLLNIMLANQTKRVSVVYAHLIRRAVNDMLSPAEQQRAAAAGAAAADDETDGEISIDKDVYAISSEDGNIKYHMDAAREYAREKKRSPIRSLQKKFFGVTIGTKNKTSNYITDKSVSPMEAR